MDNFDLKKYLVENKVTTNAQMMNEDGDSTAKIEDFVYSHPEYEELTPEELNAKIQEYKEEWESVSDNYSNIEDYFDEIENRGDFL
jgi:hypothetical protein